MAHVWLRQYPIDTKTARWKCLTTVNSEMKQKKILENFSFDILFRLRNQTNKARSKDKQWECEMMTFKSMQKHLDMWTVIFANQVNASCTGGASKHCTENSTYILHKKRLKSSAIFSCLNSCIFLRRQVQVGVCNDFHNSTFNYSVHKLSVAWSVPIDWWSPPHCLSFVL